MKIAYVLHFKPLGSKELVRRLEQICIRKRVAAERSTLFLLSELTDGDVRSCISTLQFLSLQSREQHGKVRHRFGVCFWSRPPAVLVVSCLFSLSLSLPPTLSPGLSLPSPPRLLSSPPRQSPSLMRDSFPLQAKVTAMQLRSSSVGRKDRIVDSRTVWSKLFYVPRKQSSGGMNGE